MINFNLFDIQRSIIHYIPEKTQHQDHAIARLSYDMVGLSEGIADLVKERLINAAGRQSRAFRLKFGESGEGSFYQICDGLREQTDQEFIDRSQAMANLLARSQKTRSIPSGYLLILDGTYESNEKSLYIVIKAEPHEALQFTSSHKGSQLELLEEVFLSPSQRLFKVGIIEEVDLAASEVEERYNCYLFDHQFSDRVHTCGVFLQRFFGL